MRRSLDTSPVLIKLAEALINRANSAMLLPVETHYFSKSFEKNMPCKMMAIQPHPSASLLSPATITKA
jgi:hypothetical protein